MGIRYHHGAGGELIVDPSDLKVGVLLPLWTGSLAGQTPGLHEVLGFARVAEHVAAGAEHLSVIPHPWDESGLERLGLVLEVLRKT